MTSFWRSKPTFGTQVNRLHPQARGLVARWSLNEGAGKIYDALGGLAGTLTNGASWSSGKDGSALKFGGATQYVSTGSVTVPVPYTILASVRLDATNANWSAIFAKTTSIGFWLDNGRQIQFGNTGTHHGGVVTLGVWARVGVSINNISSLCSLNGTISGTSASTNFAALSAWNLIGNDVTSGSGNFTGLIGDVVVYSRAFAAADFAVDYADPYGMFLASPAMRYAKSGRPRLVDGGLTSSLLTIGLAA